MGPYLDEDVWVGKSHVWGASVKNEGQVQEKKNLVVKMMVLIQIIYNKNILCL